jgi:integrase
MAKEKLPKAFERLPSGSLRVRIRVRGHLPATKVFPLFADNPHERQRQRHAAEAWATETRVRLLAGTHVSTREAEKLTLGQALQRYADRGLTGRESNARKDRNRIKRIQADPIAQRGVASLRARDLADYRDKLLSRGKEEHGRPLARTTISNTVQLISRALKFVGEKIDGVPEIGGVSMPKASPGRVRRLSPDEERAILGEAKQADPLLPLIIRFAILTALRRERILSFRLSHIVEIGKGRKAIRFPPSDHRAKKAGIVPITAELQQVIDAALALRPATTDNDSAVFAINGVTMDHKWRAAVKAVKIADLHFHDLRHEATSRYFEAGLSTAEVMSITGHSTKEMVDRYSHYSAAIVLDKLENPNSVEVIEGHIRRLVADYVRAGGDAQKLHNLINRGFERR